MQCIFIVHVHMLEMAQDSIIYQSLSNKMQGFFRRKRRLKLVEEALLISDVLVIEVCGMTSAFIG